MAPIVWGHTDNGKFVFMSMTPQTLQDGLELIRKSYLIDENVSRAVELFKNPAAIKELDELTLRTAKDGVSIVAIETATGIVAAAAFNKLQVPALSQTYLQNYAAGCKEASAKSLVQFLFDADAECDLFEHCNSDCSLEIMFSTTSPAYRRNGIARKLFECTIELGKKLKAGENVKVSMNGEPLSLEPVPKIVSAICTSIITQNIARALNFEKVGEIDYNRWSFNGKSFSERISPETPTTTLDALRI